MWLNNLLKEPQLVTGSSLFKTKQYGSIVYSVNHHFIIQLSFSLLNASCFSSLSLHIFPFPPHLSHPLLHQTLIATSDSLYQLKCDLLTEDFPNSPVHPGPYSFPHSTYCLISHSWLYLFLQCLVSNTGHFIGSCTPRSRGLDWFCSLLCPQCFSLSSKQVLNKQNKKQSNVSSCFRPYSNNNLIPSHGTVQTAGTF